MGQILARKSESSLSNRREPCYCLIKLATLLRRELPSLPKGHPTESQHVSVPSTRPINLLPQVFYHSDNFTGHVQVKKKLTSSDVPKRFPTIRLTQHQWVEVSLQPVARGPRTDATRTRYRYLDKLHSQVKYKDNWMAPSYCIRLHRRSKSFQLAARVRCRNMYVHDMGLPLEWALLLAPTGI